MDSSAAPVADAALVAEARATPWSARPGRWARRALDIGLRLWAGAGAFGVAGLVVVLAVVLGLGARAACAAFGWRFLTSTEWDPVAGVFGALPAIWGTLASSLLALVIAVPVSVGAAVFLVRLAPRWLAGPASFLVELLAAIPSIAYGFWGSAELVPFMQRTVQPWLKAALGGVPVLKALVAGPCYGFGMLTAALVLAIMIAPIITAVTRDVLRATPRELDEGAYALGATWAQATRLVLGFCKVGIFGAVVLGLARAVGETMAVTMVIGNRDQLSLSLLAPGQTMASLLANQFLEADNPLYVSTLVEIALVLLATTLAMNTAARALIARATRAPRRAAAAAQAEPAALGAAVAVAAPAALAAVAARSEARPAAAARPPRAGVSLGRRVADWSAKGASVACAGACVLCLALILGYLLWRGIAGLSWDFFTKLPGPSGQPSGMRNCIVGSLQLVGMASLVGVPAGMACGVFLSEFARRSRFGGVVRMLVDVLAGVPSIVVGVVAYELVVVPMGHFSGLAGALGLALLMCPIIARTTEEMLRLVPDALREASLGAGATRAQTILRVVLPAAASGIVTGVMLAVARVAGETAPLLFTALGNDGDVHDPLRPFPALTLKIFAYATSPDEEWKRQAWAGMLVLIVLILALNLLMRAVARQRTGSTP